MPSDFLTPFLEVERALCKDFAGTEASQAAGGFRRRRSPWPSALPDPEAGGDDDDGDGEPPLTRRGRLSRVPFGTERSLSVPAEPSRPGPSARYKTELCRAFEESGVCKYGAKCQFAHGARELRGLSRHPKYKTEPCRTFHTVGFCPYGARCHFIHNGEEVPEGRSQRRPLRHSLSFAGFARAERSPPSPRACSASPPGSPRLLSPLLPEPGLLRPCPFSADPAPGSFAPGGRPPGSLAPPGLRRCSSADSLSLSEGYASSCSLGSACESPGRESRRLPIFSRLSVTDE